jgi:hypothetical protein
MQNLPFHPYWKKSCLKLVLILEYGAV